MTSARLSLAIAVGAITVIALAWFIASFFVLDEATPRAALAAPAVAVLADIGPAG